MDKEIREKLMSLLEIQNLKLTPSEKIILSELIQSDSPVSREYLRGNFFPSRSYSNIVDCHIKNLRAKLPKDVSVVCIRGSRYSPGYYHLILKENKDIHTSLV